MHVELHVINLGCFKCPSCAKPYISATWFQKHLSKCPQPTGAIMGLNLTELNNKSNNNNH